MRPRPGTIYHFEGTFARPEYKELDNGIIGDATKATREKGEKLVTRVVDYTAELIEDIRSRYKVGEKPPVAISVDEHAVREILKGAAGENPHRSQRQPHDGRHRPSLLPGAVDNALVGGSGPPSHSYNIPDPSTTKIINPAL